ncbi:MAG: tyrosine-protein phosphatase [Pseudomonadota bacterium]
MFTLRHDNVRPYRGFLLLALLMELSALSSAARADSPVPVPATISAAYDRVLPLEGGSNFRDMGGLFTTDGQRVRRGLLFRSGVMTSLTEDDMDYLDQFGFERVVDLRSSEERELYPNHWATKRGVEVVAHEYSMRELMKRAMGEDGQPSASAMHNMYKTLPYMLEPQLKLFFAELVAGNAPLAVNCSAGQDRTGISSALLLLALGVPKDVVMQDYLNSTRFRRPVIERGDVDLVAAAEDNFFAAVMLRYSGESGEVSPASPLLTDKGVPYLRFAMDQLEQDFGSIEAFLEARVGVDAADIQQLRSLYLESPFSASLQ